MSLKRSNVPADIRLSGSQLPGHGGEASGLYHPGKAMHQQESIHGEAASKSYSCNLRINVIPIRQTYLIRRGGGHCQARIRTFETGGEAGRPFAARLRRI